MKLAVFSPISLEPTLGAAKHRIDQANAMETHGWSTSLFDHTTLGIDKDYLLLKNSRDVFNEALKEYLKENAEKYDVVLYEYDTLPYPRNLFSDKALFVASPSLLFYHFQNIKFPLDVKSKIAKALTFFKPSKYTEYNSQTKYSLLQADVIQVQNNLDKAILHKKGYSAKAIITVPCGLSSEHSKLLKQIVRNYETQPSVAFVGTFDLRKGAVDFPKIISKILHKVPGCTFKLLGTKGMLTNAQQVLDYFPKKLQAFIKVIPSFPPNQLPLLLSDCHVGMFPSYIESFGLGALEMMTAGLPVVCYRSPGPSDFVPAHLLAAPGDVDDFVNKIVTLLEDRERLKQQSRMAVAISEQYCWTKIAQKTSETYKELISRKHLIEV